MEISNTRQDNTRLDNTRLDNNNHDHNLASVDQDIPGTNITSTNKIGTSISRSINSQRPPRSPASQHGKVASNMRDASANTSIASISSVSAHSNVRRKKYDLSSDALPFQPIPVDVICRITKNTTATWRIPARTNSERDDDLIYTDSEASHQDDRYTRQPRITSPADWGIIVTPLDDAMERTAAQNQQGLPRK